MNKLDAFIQWYFIGGYSIPDVTWSEDLNENIICSKYPNVQIFKMEDYCENKVDFDIEYVDDNNKHWYISVIYNSYDTKYYN